MREKALLERAHALIERIASKFDMDAIANGHGGPGVNTELRRWLKDYADNDACRSGWSACQGCPMPNDCRMHGCGVARNLWTLPEKPEPTPDETRTSQADEQGRPMTYWGGAIPHLTHWSKDPLVPYVGCDCSTCEIARRPATVIVRPKEKS